MVSAVALSDVSRCLSRVMPLAKSLFLAVVWSAVDERNRVV
jgi:hypothetical protein